MDSGKESSHVGRAGEGVESHPVQRATDQTTQQQDTDTLSNMQADEAGGSTNQTAATTNAVGRAGEDGKPTCKEREPEITGPQADSADERAKDKPRQPEDSATNKTVKSNMELEPWQQVLLALERQRAEFAEREGARIKEIAELRADVTKQLADQRTDFVDRDAARAKETADQRVETAGLRVETADLRAETARGFQHMTMWFAGLSFGMFAVLVAIVGVGIQFID